MLGAFAIVKSTEYGLLSARTLGVGGASLVLLGAFFALESRISNPIMPLRMLRLRMLMGSSLVRGLLVTGMFSAFFLGALYLERVLGYDAIDTGPRVHAARRSRSRRCRWGSRSRLSTASAR